MESGLPSVIDSSGWIGRWNQVSRQMRRELGDRYAQSGLTESRAAVLQALAESDRRITQAELAGELSLSESSLCGIVEKMRQEGWIEQVRSAVDRRRCVLSLTPQGRLRCQEIERIHAELTRELLSQLIPAPASASMLTLDELMNCLQSLDAMTISLRRSAA